MSNVIYDYPAFLSLNLAYYEMVSTFLEIRREPAESDGVGFKILNCTTQLPLNRVDASDDMHIQHCHLMLLLFRR